MKISPSFLQSLERLPSRFQFRYSSRSRNEGEKRIPHRFGEGTEFSQHKKYNPGDDIRYIDWNLYARFQSFYVKTFSPEESQTVYVLIDASRSMDFGSPRKFDCALTLTAGLTLLSLRALDRVSVYLWDTNISRRLINLRGVPSFSKVIKFLESAVPCNRATDLPHSCRELINENTIPGQIWIISDFYDTDQFDEAFSLLEHHRFHPLPIRIIDRSEMLFTHSGICTLIDSESGYSEPFLATKSQKKEYTKRFEQLSIKLRKSAQSHGITLREMMTDNSAEGFIMKLLKDYQ